MSGKNTIVFNKPDLFSPSITRKLIDGAYTTVINYKDAVQTNIESTASFRYDPPGAGLKSTQQLNVDFSNFANHTFYNSAEVNVNVAFDKIINGYPFDGTKKEVESFFDSLSGFEKYVYDQFPKNKGYLIFSGTQVGEDTNGTKGTFITVNDYAGGKFPTLSKKITGDNILDPGKKTISFEFHLLIPPASNDNQAIFQKVSGSSNGIGLFLSRSVNTSRCDLLFLACSGTNVLQTNATVLKGQFNHICAIFDRSDAQNKLQVYVNENLASESTGSNEFGSIDFRISPLTIGSGSAQRTTGSSGLLNFVPRQTLSGAIDEFRVFHDKRTTLQQKNLGRKSIFPDSSLVLYYKFNEPTGTLGSTSSDSINRIILDSSGNSLHSEISSAGFSFGLRTTGTVECPMTHEKLSLSPILFPNYSSIVELNESLLTTASDYDTHNPNLITRLVPKHYFLEGKQLEGLSDEDGTIGDAYTGEDIPGSGELGTAQLLASFLYVYAKFFDELKMMIDSFGKVLNVGYDTNNRSPDNFLPLIANYYGFKLPGLFSDATIEQFVEAENITDTIGTSDLPLRTVQNQILKRVLSNLGEVIRSKGTLNSIKSFIRAIGIDPDNSFRIKEYGGPTKGSLHSLRHNKTDISTLLNFSGSASAFITSSFLSGSRTEIGFPDIRGNYIHVGEFPPHGISNDRSDGLFTSGSWTYEAFYKFPVNNNLTHTTQSLARLCVTGSLSSSLNGAILVNLLATSASSDSLLRLYARPGFEAASPTLTLDLTGTDIFDGNKWHIAFGRERGDKLGFNTNCSYFLRCEKRVPGEQRKLFITQSYFTETLVSNPFSSSFQRIESFANGSATDDNVSGTFIFIGSQSLQTGGNTSNFKHLNNTTNVVNEARNVIFNGEVGHIRFWSKALSEDELEEHAANFKSLGVEDPSTNFNFVKTRSGSYERIRMDVSTDQPITSSNAAGEIELFDFSKNGLHMLGSNFQLNKGIINVEFFNLAQLSTTFDEASTDNKIRVRSYSHPENYVDEPYAVVAPLYEIPKSESPIDDTRFSIDYSVVDSLNQDIINLFSSLESFDDILGNPDLLFSETYPILEDIRQNVYFNRFSTGEKLKIHSYINFFKWVSTSIGGFIEQLLPRTTRFQGLNYVIENSLLERPKFDYSAQADIFLGEQFRTEAHSILLQQIAGVLKKY